MIDIVSNELYGVHVKKTRQRVALGGTETPMTSNERNAWIMLLTSIPAYLIYVVIVVTSVDGGAITEAEYMWPALSVIGASIIANIVLGIIASILQPRDNRVDERDRAIERVGERAGNSFLVIGALGAMVMAMVEWDWFWIGNALMLAFFVSAVVGSLVKISAYRLGLQ